MAYSKFKIIELPKRTTLYIPNILGEANPPIAELDKEYDINLEAEIQIDPFLEYPANPLDYFVYRILPTNNGKWSDPIKFFINVDPQSGTPVCQIKSLPVDYNSKTDITNFFEFDIFTDRIIIHSMSNNKILTIDGKIVEFNKVYMRYEFKNVFFDSSNIEEDQGVVLNHTDIIYSVGNKNTIISQNGGSDCKITLIPQIKAEIYHNNPSLIERGLTFSRKFYVRKGIPLKNSLININIPTKISSSYITYKDSSYNEIRKDLVTGDNYLTIPLDTNGFQEIILIGTPNIVNSTDPYLFSIILSLIDIDSNVNNVNQEKDNIILNVFNNNDIKTFDLIESVSMSSLPLFENQKNIYSVNIVSGTTIDVYANIETFWNEGVLPFTYSITEITTSGVVITQTSNPYLFKITALSGSVSPGINYKFLAKVTDARNVSAYKEFELTVIEVASGSVPTISSPSIINSTVGTSISEDIIASNGPIVSYRSENLPQGLGISNGKITGSVSVAGNYNATIYASNVNGESTGFNIAINITAVAAGKPIITSDSIVTVVKNTPFNYQITFDPLYPPTNVYCLTPYWADFDIINNKIIGFVPNDFIYEEIIITASNSYGTTHFQLILSIDGNQF